MGSWPTWLLAIAILIPVVITILVYFGVFVTSKYGSVVNMISSKRHKRRDIGDQDHELESLSGETLADRSVIVLFKFPKSAGH